MAHSEGVENCNWTPGEGRMDEERGFPPGERQIDEEGDLEVP